MSSLAGSGALSSYRALWNAPAAAFSDAERAETDSSLLVDSEIQSESVQGEFLPAHSESIQRVGNTGHDGAIHNTAVSVSKLNRDSGTMDTADVSESIDVEIDLDTVDTTSVFVNDEYAGGIDVTEINTQAVDVELVIADDDVPAASKPSSTEKLTVGVDDVLSPSPIIDDGRSHLPVRSRREDDVIQLIEETDARAVDIVEESTFSDVHEESEEAAIAADEEKSAPSGFIKRWAKRIVSWVKRFMGF